MTRCERPGERGQSLIFVVVMLAAFSLLALSLLGLTSTGASLAQKVNVALQQRLAADAAVEYGIHQVMEQGAAANFAETTTVLVPGAIKGDVVSITVSEVSVTSITISATTPGPGDAVVFTVTAFNGVVPMNGQSGQPGFAPIWTVTDVNDGPTNATISQAGRFMAAPGTYKVKVVVNNVSAFAKVTVVLPLP